MLLLKETNQFKKVICLFSGREPSADEDDKGRNEGFEGSHTHTRWFTTVREHFLEDHERREPVNDKGTKLLGIS